MYLPNPDIAPETGAEPGEFIEVPPELDEPDES